jgi:hypothetical protein
MLISSNGFARKSKKSADNLSIIHYRFFIEAGVQKPPAQKLTNDELVITRPSFVDLKSNRLPVPAER